VCVFSNICIYIYIVYIREINKIVLQLAAAIKAAQDATILANQERLKWQEKIKYLEVQQQTLQEREYRLLARAQDLENFTQVLTIKCTCYVFK